MLPLSRMLPGLPAVGIALVAGTAVMAPPAHATISEKCFKKQWGGDIVFAAGFQCQQGDKIYTDFVDNTGGALTSPDYTVQILEQQNLHTVALQGDLSTGIVPGNNFSFSYTVTVDDKISTDSMIGYATGATTANPLTLWTKQLFAVPAGVPNPASTAVPFATSPLSSFATPVKSARFTSTFQVIFGTATQVTDGILQRGAPVDTVPGPLPILGAAAAFGYSRKIRRRIKVAV